MRPRLLLAINCKFAVDFFARGLHTRTAVARFPLRQLGFLAYIIIIIIFYYYILIYFNILLYFNIIIFYAHQNKASRRKYWSKQCNLVATAPHSVIMVFWKETAFPRWRAMERRWNKKVVSEVLWCLLWLWWCDMVIIINLLLLLLAPVNINRLNSWYACERV